MEVVSFGWWGIGIAMHWLWHLAFGIGIVLALGLALGLDLALGLESAFPCSDVGFGGGVCNAVEAV